MHAGTLPPLTLDRDRVTLSLASDAMANAGKVLVLNSGSSSLKFKLYEIGSSSGLAALAWGLCERIGDPTNSKFKVSREGEVAEGRYLVAHLHQHMMLSLP